MNIGIIGTGRVGTALARRWAAHGHAIMFGTRDPNSAKARAAVAAIPPARAGSVAEAAAFGRAILVAVPGEAVLPTITQCGDLRGKIVIDANNWFGQRPAGVTTSIAEAISQAAPGAHVIKAFNSTGSGNMRDPDYSGLPADMFICGDDEGAKAAVAELSTSIGFNTVDVGALSAALHLEHLAQLWVHLAYQHGQGPNIAWKLMRRQ